MKRTYFPGITDVVAVADPADIRTISNDSRFDRDFIARGPIRNLQRIRKMLHVWSLNGRLFPFIQPRTSTSRAAAQDALWSKLSVKADEVKHGPEQLEPLAQWVRGTEPADRLNLLVQQSIGRLFVETFTATEESWAAASVVLEAGNFSNIMKMPGWRMSGKVERAKSLLASMLNGDPAALNATITGPRLIIASLNKMRQLAADPALRSSLTTDAAVDECLVPPPIVVRQAKTSGEVGGCPFRRGALFILELGSASKGAANRDLVFLSQSWSRCPAEKWVPALLEGVWTRVSATLHVPIEREFSDIFGGTGVKRTETLPPRDLSAPGREISQSVVELAPGTSAPRHFHPGEELTYVIQGTWEYDLDGQPPVIVKTGQSHLTPSGVVHGVRNVGSGTAIGLSTWVAEKGKPLTTLVK
jgi:quercetin dioxygenase-like cupin family protein